jgi:hypothetical protein
LRKLLEFLKIFQKTAAIDQRPPSSYRVLRQKGITCQKMGSVQAINGQWMNPQDTHDLTKARREGGEAVNRDMRLRAA